MYVSKLNYQPLILSVIGQKPTIPTDINLVPGDTGWKDTDILIGQIALNYPDNIMYLRTKNGIETQKIISTINPDNLVDLADVDFSNASSLTDYLLLFYDKITSKTKLVSSTSIPIDGGTF